MMPQYQYSTAAFTTLALDNLQLDRSVTYNSCMVLVNGQVDVEVNSRMNNSLQHANERNPTVQKQKGRVTPIRDPQQNIIPPSKQNEQRQVAKGQHSHAIRVNRQELLATIVPP